MPAGQDAAEAEGEAEAPLSGAADPPSAAEACEGV